MCLGASISYCLHWRHECVVSSILKAEYYRFRWFACWIRAKSSVGIQNRNRYIWTAHISRFRVKIAPSLICAIALCRSLIMSFSSFINFRQNENWTSELRWLHVGVLMVSALSTAHCSREFSHSIFNFQSYWVRSHLKHVICLGSSVNVHHRYYHFYFFQCTIILKIIISKS
jgi:hypothetical protein